MVRIALALFFLLASALGARALNDSAVPTKMPTPWGSSAGGAFITSPIPVPSQIGITNCAASFTDGFPPLTFQSAAAGGCAPFGKDFNGIFQMITQWLRWNQAGGPLFYDAAFSASISGYPKGSILSNASTTGCYWISTVDGNLSNPDSGGANWSPACPGLGGAVGGTSTGSANAQVVASTPFVLQAGVRVSFIPGFNNTAATTLTINGNSGSLLKQIAGGTETASSGGELRTGQVAVVAWDGSNWQLLSSTASFTGLGGTSTGSANAQAVTTTPFVLQANSRIVFIAGFSNSGATTLTVNGAAPVAINKQTPSGLAALSGGEIIAGEIVEVLFDGAVYQIVSGPFAYLTTADQVLSGGANVTSLAINAGTVNVDCGLRPMQYVPNTGAFTINAPTSDGSCFLQIENGAGASATITFSNFQVTSNTGDAITNSTTAIFVVNIWRIHGTASYFIKQIKT